MNFERLQSVGNLLAIVVLVLAIFFATGLVTPGAAWCWILIAVLAAARLL